MAKKVGLLLLALMSLGLLVSCFGGGGARGEAGLEDSTPTTVVSLEPVLLDSHLSLKGYGGKRVYGGYLVAQVFVPSSNWDVQSVRLRLWVDGVAPSFQVSLVEVVEGTFGKELDRIEVGASSLTLGDPGNMVEILLTSSLVRGQRYAIVVHMEGGNEFSPIRWVYDTGGTGGYYYSNDGGLNWHQKVDRDFVFEVWGVDQGV